jgi:hypothetical protein
MGKIIWEKLYGKPEFGQESLSFTKINTCMLYVYSVSLNCGLLFIEQIFQFKVVCQECVEGEGGSFYKHQKLRMNIRLGSP